MNKISRFGACRFLVSCAIAALASQVPAQMIVNEFDYNQVGDDNSEFVELFVTDVRGVDLGEFSLVLVDGVTGSVYQQIALGPGFVDAGEYYVVCGSAENVNLCDQEAPLATDFIQNDAPSAIALTHKGLIIDTVSYGGNSVAPYTEGQGLSTDDGVEPQLGFSRSPDGVDIDFNALNFGRYCTTPGQTNGIESHFCDGLYEIHDIQGDGLESPVQGNFVDVRGGIVTGVRSGGAFNGFFMEAPLDQRDQNPDTSEGIFVRTSVSPSVEVGDEVNVTGLVGELSSMTMIISPGIQVISQLNPEPPPVMFNENLPSPMQPGGELAFERFEGMQVGFDGLAVGPLAGGAIAPVVASQNRPFREPGIAFPGEPGLPVWDANPEILDVLIESTPFEDQIIFAGQPVLVEGNILQFGGHFIQPTKFLLGQPPVLPRPVSERQADEMLVASQNMGDFFNDVNDPATDDLVFPSETVQDRIEEMSHHIRLNLRAPDVIALQEIETQALGQALVDQIALDDPGLSYSFHMIEGPDFNGLDLAYLTRDDTITVNTLEALGADEIADSGFPLYFHPPLLLSVSYAHNGAQLDLVLVNVQLDAYPVFTLTPAARVRKFDQAISLASKVQSLQAADANTNLVVLGDFGAPEFTDGIVDVVGQVSGEPDALGAEFEFVDIVNPALTNLVANIHVEERYSVILNGNSILLDHVLVNSQLLPHVIKTEMSRGNADSPLSPNDNFSEGSRVSDRDGVVIYVQPDLADADGDGVNDSIDNCTLTSNVSQLDTNGDGFGNVCDADVNNDGIVNFLDLVFWVDAFASVKGDTNWNADTDLNGDGVVNFLDISLVQQGFLKPPGPSGLNP